jgi:lipoprotein-releasing system permease protein
VYRLKIILRYLRARRVTLIPVAAVAVAVFLLVVVLSVMSGFISFIEGKIRGTLADVIVDYDDVRGFSDYEEIETRLAALKGVQAVSPRLSGKGMLTVYEARTADQPHDFHCIFVGVDPDAENGVTQLDRMLVSEGRRFEWPGEGEKLPGLILGNEVLGQYPGIPGTLVSLTTPTATDEDSSLKFRVTNHFKSGLYEYDRTTVYVPLEAAQQLTALDGRITSFHVRAGKDVDLVRLKKAVTETLPAERGFVVKTWVESEKVLIDAMRLERVIWVVILSALLAVAWFCILAVMSLTVVQKTRDIGILRSLGASVGGVLWTFVQYGLAVGLIGSTLGLAAGLAVLWRLDPIERFLLNGYVAVALSWVLGTVLLTTLIRLFLKGRNRFAWGAVALIVWTAALAALTRAGRMDPLLDFGRKHLSWTPWPKEVFYFDSIPRDMDWRWMVVFWAGGILVSFLASLIPAARAARTNTVLTLRYEQ